MNVTATTVRPADAVKAAAVRVLEQWDGIGQFDVTPKSLHMTAVLDDLRSAVLATAPAPPEPPLAWQTVPEVHTARRDGKVVAGVTKEGEGVYRVNLWVAGTTTAPTLPVYRNLLAAKHAAEEAVRTPPTVLARSVRWASNSITSLGELPGTPWEWRVTEYEGTWKAEESCGAGWGMVGYFTSRSAAKHDCEQRAKAVGQ